MDYLSENPATLAFTSQTFAQVLSQILPGLKNISPHSVDLLILHLTRDVPNPVAVYSPTAKVIKFASPGSTSRPEPVSEADVSMAQLQTLIRSVKDTTASLEKQVEDVNIEIRVALQAKDKAKAMQKLRLRKVYESSLGTRRNMSHQLETVLLQIEDSKSRVDMVRALDSSTGVLKQLNLEVGGVEGVDKVLDALQGQMDISKEINDVINGVGTSAVDESEIEDELDMLLAANKAQEEEEQRQAARAEAEALRKRLAELESVAAIPAAVPSGPAEAVDNKDDTAKDVEARMSALMNDLAL